MKSKLKQVALHEFDGAAEPIESLPGPEGLWIGIDVDDVEVHAGPDRTAVVLAFSLTLGLDESEEVVCDITAVFRLVYEVAVVLGPAEQKRLVLSQAFPDAWPYWRTFLESTMTAMGLVPPRLPPHAPPELAPEIVEAFETFLESE